MIPFQPGGPARLVHASLVTLTYTLIKYPHHFDHREIKCLISSHFQLTAPPVNTRALSFLSSVAGEALTKHLSRILPALMSSLKDKMGTEEEQQVCGMSNCFIGLIYMNILTTVETLYNTVNFCWSTHKRHSIARPKGRGMGCLFWVQKATYCVDLSKLSSIKYLL